ncbi:diguanylate cyclase/phosphodiesterase [Lachnospiraceae bacterium]|nr:diguanylate cyclase/phosphodiesterase [Lachnospiraceae bacterium]
MMNYTFAFGIALSALLICVVNIVYTIIQKRTDKTQNKLFLTIYIFLAINAGDDIVTALFGANPFLAQKAPYVMYASSYIYFATHTLLCPLFFYYVSNISFASTRVSNLKMILISMPMVITELMSLTNPLTHIVWYYEDYVYHRGKGMTLIYVAALVYYVMAIVVLVNSWRVISEKRKNALVFFVVMVAAGVTLQMIRYSLRFEILSEVLGLLGAMMAVENEDERLYPGTSFYNRAALNLDIEGCMKHNRKFSLLLIRVNNHDIVNRLVGSGEINAIIDMISDYIKSVVKRYYVYVADRSTIVITLYDEMSDKADTIAENVLKRFDDAWEYKDFSVLLNATVMVADIPSQIKNTSELFYMLDGKTAVSKEKRVLRDDDLGFIMRKQTVEEALSRGFSENSYEVYYQPTYNLDGTLHGAEALIRIHDKELGNLYPDEFIPIAEQSGLIDDIDNFVLEEVCQFIKSGIPHKYGMSGINVNLSVVHCMRPGFVEEINGIADKYGIRKRMINFEVTESVAASDYEIFSNVIFRLKKEGFMFSMDDYGTGYSNVNSIFTLDFDVIKIDKSILWGAETNELGMTILENTIRMIQQMKRKILVEGVETQEQIKLLEKLKVDYLQGFYFSKPIPKKEFLKLISMEKVKTIT